MQTKTELGRDTRDPVSQSIDVYMVDLITRVPNIRYAGWISLEDDLGDKVQKVGSFVDRSRIYKANADNLLMCCTVFPDHIRKEGPFGKTAYLLLCQSYYSSAIKNGLGLINRPLIKTLKRLYTNFSKWVRLLEGINFNPECQEQSDREFEQQINDIYNGLDLTLDN